jgi:hypothetical protein
MLTVWYLYNRNAPKEQLDHCSKLDMRNGHYVAKGKIMIKERGFIDGPKATAKFLSYNRNQYRKACMNR